MRREQYNIPAGDRRKKVEQILAELQGCQEINFAYVYGSFSEGLPFHDIDIGIFLSEPAQEGVISYMLDLGQKLSREARIPVDVWVLNDAPLSFRYSVIHGSPILVRDEKMQTLFVEETIRKYLDLKPRIRRAIKEAFAG